jgi:hypothetical protein
MRPRALTLADRAQAIREEQVRKEPRQFRRWANRMDPLLTRATLRRKRGDHVWAVRQAEALGVAPGLIAKNSYTLACVYDRALAVAATEPNMPPAERRSPQDRYGAQTVAAFPHSGAKEFQNVATIRNNSDLDPLRGRGASGSFSKTWTQGGTIRKTPGRMNLSSPRRDA